MGYSPETMRLKFWERVIQAVKWCKQLNLIVKCGFPSSFSYTWCWTWTSFLWFSSFRQLSLLQRSPNDIRFLLSLFYRFLCEEWNSDNDVHSSELVLKSRGLALIFSCSRSCLSGAMATLDRRCSRKFSTRWRRTSPFARGETPEWIHPTSL